MRKLVALALSLSLLVAESSLAASRDPVRGRRGMVASTSEIASRIGIDVLRRGGNAIDAAVAVALALAVTWPSAGNLGGGGFMLVRRADGTAEMIDYRERAPLAATRDMYLDASGKVIENASTVGYKAVGVPGTVAGLALARDRHGRLPWATLVQPARKLAAEGFVVNQHLARSLSYESSRKRLSPFPESNRILLRNGKLYAEGETLIQSDLGRTLLEIEKDGPRAFYEGQVSRRLVADMKANGGLITARDLKEYEPTVRQPIRGTYRGYEILTVPPPSSGGSALIEMLNMLEGFNVGELGHNSAQSLHLLVEVMRRAFADRAKFMGDADFVKVPVAGMISREFAAARMKSFDPARVTASSEIAAGTPAGYESPDTTHFTVVDGDGNVVSNTYTLNDSFGSGVMAKGTGFLLNDEMDDFTSKPGVANAYGLIQSEANAIEPRKRPLSSMTPTIVSKDGNVWFAIGSPGGPTIINTVLQVILNVIDHGMDIQEAIDAPRIHHQWLPDEISWERGGLNRDTRNLLEKMGHRFREVPRSLGDAEGVMIDSRTGVRLGASDPRLGGVPVGY
ncbi:MAG TPA: gamma-glutamyltransferase [Thermoanaerobaculia bacterium]|nr:gamma-glutamyltransferase [Thermoanaerobaculia bacterium]